MCIQIIIVDDEPHALAGAKRVVEGLRRDDIIVLTFASVAEAMAYLEDQPMVALIFCDVEMPGTDGFSAVTLLRDKCQRFVYLTGHADYLDKANDTDAEAFLLKPLRERQLLRQLAKLKKATKAERDGETLRFVNDGTNRRLHAITLKEITHVQGAKDYIVVNTADKSHIVYHTLKGFLAETGVDGKFIQIHKSTIVSAEAIEALGERMVTLKNGKSFVVGAKHMAALDTFWKQRLIGKRKMKTGD